LFSLPLFYIVALLDVIVDVMCLLLVLVLLASVDLCELTCWIVTALLDVNIPGEYLLISKASHAI
jgi:hypothetical protein